MMDRDKVIKGLKTIKQFFGYGLPSTAEMFDSYYGILNDTIAILKEQEARVLSMGELLKLEKAEAPCVWLEVREITDRYWFEGWAEPVCYNEIETELYGFGVDVPVEAKLCDYGVEYRCWNHEPTEAQMKAVPWDE